MVAENSFSLTRAKVDLFLSFVLQTSGTRGE
jgi:hypothetical protein